MKISRIFQRLTFYSFKTGLNLLSLFNHRMYMRYYVPLLHKYGMQFDGQPRYIAKTVQFDDFNKIRLSERVVISGDVRFLTHDYSYTTAQIAIGGEILSDIAITRPISIGRNVFIGARSFVLPGTTIEDNCIVGAGTVVRGHIPSGSVVIGNPGKVICSIEHLAEKWKALSKDMLRQD